MGKGKMVGGEAREIIYKVYLFCAVEAKQFKTEDGYFQKVQQRVATATGVSIKFVYNLLKDKGKYAEPRTKTYGNTLKRKLNNEESNQGMNNDKKKEPVTESIVKPDQVLPTNPSLLETVLKMPHRTYPGNTRNASQPLIKVRPIHEMTKPSTVIPTMPGTGTTVKAPQTHIKVQRMQQNVQLQPKVITPQTGKPKPGFIKLQTIPQNATSKIVLAPNQKDRILKLYQIPRESLPNTILKPAQNTAQRHNIEIKTVPIEFDPLSFKSEIKSESNDSNSS